MTSLLQRKRMKETRSIHFLVYVRIGMKGGMDPTNLREIHSPKGRNGSSVIVEECDSWKGNQENFNPILKIISKYMKINNYNNNNN